MNADRLARWYRWIEYAAFGRTLERARCELLPGLAKARRVLVFGEGDGRALRRLLELAPEARVDVIESSGRMIALARQRVGVERVEFHQIDALSTAWPEGRYDAIVTQFFLDCFEAEDVDRLVSRMMARLEAGGVWLVTEFAIPARGWRRWHAVALVRVMYEFFGVATGLRNKKLPDLERLRLRSGMQCMRRAEWRAGLIRGELWVNR